MFIPASTPDNAIPAGSVPKEIFNGEIKSPFWEKSWNSERVYGWKGPFGGEAFCGHLSSHGALAVASGGQQFYNHVSLEMWVRTADGVPDLRLQLKGRKGVRINLGLSHALHPVGVLGVCFDCRLG